jgi:molecular chaperone GrpE
LTAEKIDAILADFRGYLEALASPPSAPEVVPTGIDVATVVAQFTALRQDVNLQTKASRAATEQAGELAKQAAATPKPAASDPTAPLVKGLIEMYDALANSHRQIASAKAALEPLLAKLASPSLPTPPAAGKPGLFARLAGTPATLADWTREAVAADAQRTATAAEAGAKLSPLLAGLADGYTMSLRRVEKALEAAGLVAIPTVGRAFDPELMEVVEVVAGGGSGVVVDEVRRGYTKNAGVVRFALVKVSR